MALPLYAWGLGPLEGFRRIPAIQVGQDPEFGDDDIAAEQTSVTGRVRRQILGSRRSWSLKWRGLFADEAEWLLTLQYGQRYPSAPSLHLRDGTWSNLLPSRARFNGAPTEVGPDGVSPAWTSASFMTDGVVPIDTGESVTVTYDARRRAAGTSTSTPRIQWLDAAGANLSLATGAGVSVGTTWTTVSVTATRPSDARGATVGLAAGTVVSVSRPRLTLSGTAWSPPGGSARVSVADLDLTRTSPTETDVRLRLVEVG